MLSRSFGMEREAAAIEAAVTTVLESGLRTVDVAGPADTPVGTGEFTAAVVQAMS